MRLLDRTACGTIGDIRAREIERPPAIVAAAGVELRGMVREGEQMPLKKLIEAKTRDVELSLGLFALALRNQHIGKTPIDFRITARKRWQEQRFRVASAALARADFRQVHTCLHIAGQVGNCTPIPVSGETMVRYGHEFPPQHAELKAYPRQRKGRNVIVRGMCLPIDSVRFGKAFEIGQQRAERNQIFEPAARCSDAATRSEHRVELHATRLIDRQRVALDCLARSAHQRRTRKMASCIVKAMYRRSDLGFDKRCAKRIVRARKLRGECLQTVERIQIAKILRRQTLLVDNRLGRAGEARVLGKARPCATARAVKVDRGDLPVGRGWIRKIKSDDCTHVAPPKRDFKLSRPVLSNGVNFPLTPAAPKYCTRQSTTEPLLLGVTSSMPVQREAAIPVIFV